MASSSCAAGTLLPTVKILSKIIDEVSDGFFLCETSVGSKLELSLESITTFQNGYL
jgi:hypothetical protein